MIVKTTKRNNRVEIECSHEEAAQLVSQLAVAISELNNSVHNFTSPTAIIREY
jgi:hypothetical protein